MKKTLIENNQKKCPVCGGEHFQGISRITGYLSLDERFGAGKQAERSARVDHNSDNNNNYNF